MAEPYGTCFLELCLFRPARARIGPTILDLGDQVNLAVGYFGFHRFQPLTRARPVCALAIVDIEQRAVHRTQDLVFFVGQKSIRLPVQRCAVMRAEIAVAVYLTAAADQKERIAILDVLEALASGVVDFVNAAEKIRSLMPASGFDAAHLADQFPLRLADRDDRQTRLFYQREVGEFRF